ncbi:hypothetical protein [Bacillus phage BillyBob]|nr:hypothetical protein [Bacillus phage BillyBob]
MSNKTELEKIEYDLHRTHKRLEDIARRLTNGMSVLRINDAGVVRVARDDIKIALEDIVACQRAVKRMKED